MAMVPYAPGIDTLGTDARDMNLGGASECGCNRSELLCRRGGMGPNHCALNQCCIGHADHWILGSGQELIRKAEGMKKAA